MMIAATARGTAVRPAAAAGQQRRHLRPSAAAAAARPRTLAAAPASRGAAAAGARRASHLAAAGRYEAPSSAAGSVVVEVQPDEAAVAAYLCSAVEAAAQKAIAERGCFTLAIPGGRWVGCGHASCSMTWGACACLLLGRRHTPSTLAAGPSDPSTLPVRHRPARLPRPTLRPQRAEGAGGAAGAGD